MKLFSRLLQMFPRVVRVIALLPVLTWWPVAYAEIDLDDRQREVQFSQAELDQLLAPIALYPDTVLSQVLIASTYPIEVVQADRWVEKNPNSKGADAVARVENQDWDPSVKALVAFPDILRRMSDDVDWTQKLGDAFLSDEGRVMDSVQNLRKKAYNSGNLNKVQHLKVEREADQIIIEPAQERVVYVPVYDTRVVYGGWWWPDYPPVYWHQPASYVYISGFYWGPSIYIGPTFFYSSCRWRERQVVVIDRHYHYTSHPVFYTGRSISRYQGARVWRHEPEHRRGVAYYDNRLREQYGSRRESYRDARVYREQQSPMHTQPRSNGVYRASDQTRPQTERAQQLRERMNQREGNSFQQPLERTTGRDTRNIDNSERQRGESRGRITGSEQERTRDVRSPTEMRINDNLGATRPSLHMSQGSNEERSAQGSRAENALRNREMHNDGRSQRQLQNDRSETRQERGNSRTQERSNDNNRSYRVQREM
ncbi:MAG TPA: DUF3300 domain-containing protein [Cellvibrio sp.]|nr:DUF3300 domain-containing protein [Cellvibrio sp.]